MKKANLFPSVTVVIPTFNRERQLQRLLDSLVGSSYKRDLIEILIVNNGGPLSSAFSKFRVINNTKNVGLAAARNQGASEATGKYVLFIDDDNVVDEGMIEQLVLAIEKFPDLLAAGPVTYYLNNKKKIWFLGSKLNLWTTKPTFYKTIQKKRVVDENLFVIENLHNCLMIPRKRGEAVGWFDEKIFMNGTEFDLIQRMKEKNSHGFCVTVLNAYCYHDVPGFDQNLVRSLGFENPKRAYYFQRNRGLFVKRYGNLLQSLLLFFIFYPFFFCIYGILFLRFGKMELFKQHFLGTVAGYGYLMRKY